MPVWCVSGELGDGSRKRLSISVVRTGKVRRKGGRQLSRRMRRLSYAARRRLKLPSEATLLRD